MAKTDVQGNDTLLFIDPNGGTNWDLIVCLQSNSIDRTTNEIDAGSKCGPSIQAGTQTIKVSFEFNDMYNTSNGEISEAPLHTLWANKTVFSWKFGPATPALHDVYYTGKGFLSALALAANKNTAVTGTGTIAVQGTIVQTVMGS